MKKIVLSFVSLLFVGVVAAQTADEVNLKFNEAAELFKAKKFEEAISAFEATIKLAESSSDEVVETLTQAQTLLVTSCINAGANLAKEAKYDEGLVLLLKASSLAELSSPKDKPKADNMIATIYAIEGAEKVKAEDYKAASEFYIKAVAANDKNTKNILLAAQTSAKAGDMAKAGEFYESLIALGATHSKYAEDAATAKTAYTTDLMNIAATATDFDAANVAIQKVIAFDPASAVAYSNLIKSANNFKNYDAVISNGDKAVELQSDPAEKSDLYFLVGAAYEIKQDKAKAIASYKNVVAGDKVAAAKAQVAALSK